MQVMLSHDHFKDAKLMTYQPIAFESDRVEFQIAKPSRNWKINKLNSPIVSINITTVESHQHAPLRVYAPHIISIRVLLGTGRMPQRSKVNPKNQTCPAHVHGALRHSRYAALF